MKKGNGLKKIAAALFATIGLIGAGRGAEVTQRGEISKGFTEIQRVDHAKIKPVTEIRLNRSSDNPYKHTRRGQLNQRQYRKLLRQNPHFRNSKKCKL